MSLLINENPLIILPSLAKAIGLNEALLLQQIHYWVAKSEGVPWVYNTYEGWRSNFPFWSISTIRRTIYHLEDLGILVSRQDESSFDRKKYYSINYEQLDLLTQYRSTTTDIEAKNTAAICSKRADVNTETTLKIKDLKDLKDLKDGSTTNEVVLPDEVPVIDAKYCADTTGLGPKTKTTSEKRSKHYDFYLALCRLTANNPELQLQKVHGMVKKLIKAGYTLKDLEYFHSYWQRDYRWTKHRRPPMVEEVYLDMEKAVTLFGSSPIQKEVPDASSLFEPGDMPDWLEEK